MEVIEFCLIFNNELDLWGFFDLFFNNLGFFGYKYKYKWFIYNNYNSNNKIC